VDRRKEYPRVPLWIRSSSRERTGGPPSYRQESPWPPQSQERPQKRQRPKGSRSKRFRPKQKSRPPRYEIIDTERITLRSPTHLADWERRAQLVEDHAELVQKAQESEQAPWPIKVWKIGDEYVLARGFASLSAAVDAGLAQVQVVVTARFPRWELAWVDPKSINGPDPLLSKALKAQEKIRSIGWVFPPLTVTPESDGRYALGRGKRSAARLWAAQEDGLATIPVVVRPRARRATVAGTVQIEVEQVRVTLQRHLRKMDKPLPSRLLSEAAAGDLRPIRVRRSTDGGYQLVDGLLRLRAAREAGLHTVRAIVEVDLPRE
jgi:hypothetical protein